MKLNALEYLIFELWVKTCVHSLINVDRGGSSSETIASADKFGKKKAIYIHIQIYIYVCIYKHVVNSK